MAIDIGLEPDPEFVPRLGSSFLEMFSQLNRHREQYPTLSDRMVHQALHGVQQEERQRAMDWIHENASYLYKA